MPSNLIKLIKDHAAASMGRTTSNHGGGGGGGGGGRCRKHPKHKQSPGVCSVCLREKLCNLFSINTKTEPTKMASFSSSSTSSSLSSSSSSPVSSISSPYFPRNPSISSISSMSSLFKRRSSSSTTITSLHFGRSLADGGRNKNSNHGFWSKLTMNRRGTEIVEEITLRSSTDPHHQTI